MSYVGDKSIVPSVPTIPVSHGEKSKKFNKTDFKRWQQNMLFYSKILNLARFITENAPVLDENKNDEQVVTTVEVWKHSNFLCRNYGLIDLDTIQCVLYQRYC